MDLYIFDRVGGGYHGSDSYGVENAEMKILGVEDRYEYREVRKTYFKNREDAEAYALPIARASFESFVSDMEADMACEDDEEELEYCKKQIAEWRRRGFHMVRSEELKEDDLFYEHYHSNKECTNFICPVEHDCDRIGGFYGSISKGKAY